MAVSVVAPSLAGTWTLDPSHSSLEFAVKHLVISTTRGRFNNFSGSLVFGSDEPTSLVAQVEIDAASVDTRDAQRDGHLRSADFFDAEQFPSLSFTSRRLEPLGGARYRLVGDLTIRGVSREVVLDAEALGVTTDPWGGTRAGFTASTSIDRKEYGLVWNAPLESGGLLVGDQVKINLEVEAIKQ